MAVKHIRIGRKGSKKLGVIYESDSSVKSAVKRHFSLNANEMETVAKKVAATLDNPKEKATSW